MRRCWYRKVPASSRYIENWGHVCVSSPTPLPDAYNHIFILRIWIESQGNSEMPTKWRGMIEHLPSKTQHFFENVDAIPSLIAPYLDAMEVETGHPTWLEPLRSILCRSRR